MNMQTVEINLLFDDDLDAVGGGGGSSIGKDIFDGVLVAGAAAVIIAALF
jgi:hypothetical protein